MPNDTPSKGACNRGPPSGSKQAFLESAESLLHYSCSGLPFTVMGDVNIDMLSLNASARQLTELVNTFGCENAITNATRLTGKTATLLNICITNSWSPSLVAGAISLEISDHLPIFCAFPERTGVISENHCAYVIAISAAYD